MATLNGLRLSGLQSNLARRLKRMNVRKWKEKEESHICRENCPI